MEALTNPRSPFDPPAAARPRWVMLNNHVDNKEGASSVADARTTAASCTSSGQFFSVSFSIAAPPASSSFYCDWIGGAPPSDGRQRRIFPDKDDTKSLRIIAAHDDSVLIEMRVPNVRGASRTTVSLDYFLYEAGAARPPLLSLLPGCYESRQFERDNGARHVPTRSLSPRALNNTGVLRRGDGEFVVAQLEVMYNSEGAHDTGELCVLQPGRDWDLKLLPIVHHEGGKLPQWSDMDAAVPVGSRFLCWVDYVSGFYVCDMAESSPMVIRYVPLPVPPPEEHRHYSDRPYLPYCRNLAAAGPDAVRFVSVAPRCCCGGPGKTSCKRSRFAFNVTTWTLGLRTEGPMAWVKDGVLDCDELWQLPNYGCLPRVVPQYPIVSSDNPDVVCFVVCENRYMNDNADKTVWLVEIDTRSKALLSAVPGDDSLYLSDSRVRAKLRW